MELAFDESAVPYIEQFLYARDVMYINCYEHPKKIVAEKMLGRAFEDFRKQPDGDRQINASDLAMLTDQEMIQLMLSCSGPGTVAHRMVEALVKGNVFDLITEIPLKLTPPQDGNAKDAHKQLLRDLPLVVQHWAEAASMENYQAAYLTIPEGWGTELAQLSGNIDPSKIIVAVPSWSIVDSWKKEGKIRILVRQNNGYTVKYVHQISKILDDFVRALMSVRLRVRVYADPDLGPAQITRLWDATQKFFKPPD